MFGIRRRWPALTAVGATLLYIVNNYQISGLEHLHLKPLVRSPAAGYSNPSSLGYPADSGLGFDLTQFGIQTSSGVGQRDLFSGLSQGETQSNFGIDPYAASVSERLPAWNNALSLGEKLALWQDKVTPAPPGSAPSLSLPASGPIPLPSGLNFPSSFMSSNMTSQGSIPAEGATQPAMGFTTSTATMSPLTQEAIRPGAMTSLGGSTPLAPFATANSAGDTLRMASFKIPALGPAMLNKPNVVQMLVAILRQYDVVAVQGIQSSRDDVLPLIVDKLNQSGRSYDYLIGPRVGRTAPHQQFAYVFDTAKLETDRFQLYTIDDPEDLMTFEPLVAWFRCKGVAQRDAFTFSLVNVNIEPSFADAERAVLPALIDAIERDGRHEDDWIMLGDFAGGNAQLSMLDANRVRFALSDIPTDVAGTHMLDTLIFSPRATTEFTGRAGAFDFLRKYNLSMERALEVSEHMPIWAEFSCVEGAQPGRIAPLLQ